MTSNSASGAYHRFKLDRILDAYDTVVRAASTQALKVIIAA
jgi:alcohol dehydrogenase